MHLSKFNFPAAAPHGVEAMSVPQLAEAEAPVEDRRHSILRASYLGGALAVAGALTAETAAGAVTWAKKHIAVQAKPFGEQTDSHKGLKYGVVTDLNLLEKAATVEQDVWDEKDYGNLIKLGYGPHIANSRTIVSLNGDKVEGVARLFGGNESIVPPFLNMPFDSEEDRLALEARSRNGEVEELGAISIVPEQRGNGIQERLLRVAYRDAAARGVTAFGIIMEPKRVDVYNKRFGFGYKQVGEEAMYQGGMCAAHVMDLEAIHSGTGMKNTHPIPYYWFVKRGLKQTKMQPFETGFTTDSPEKEVVTDSEAE